MEPTPPNVIQNVDQSLKTLTAGLSANSPEGKWKPDLSHCEVTSLFERNTPIALPFVVVISGSLV